MIQVELCIYWKFVGNGITFTYTFVVCWNISIYLNDIDGFVGCL